MNPILENLKLFFDWSEAWAPIIPLLILLKHRKQPTFLRHVIVYLLLAFPINFFGNMVADLEDYFPDWLQQNTYLYNLHSVIRFICFASFFNALKQDYYALIKRIIPLLYTAFAFIDLTFFENFMSEEKIAAHLFTIEAFLLLIYCLVYYLSKLKSEDDAFINGADFYVVTGLSIFVVTNFFVFLFYDTMMNENWQLADNMWSIHNVAYILFCVLIAKAFCPLKRLPENSKGIQLNKDSLPTDGTNM